ncbi:MAG TPA: hypothetical protein GXZ95_00185 [Mollicutes bacterium]|nr:hypothetical protein [Mollicutes bacterium]
MAIINVAKGLRYTITLSVENVKIRENSNLIGRLKSFKKGERKLINETYKFNEIKKVSYENLTQDTSVLKLVLTNDTECVFEMTPNDTKESEALKTQVMQIAEYIQSQTQDVK